MSEPLFESTVKLSKLMRIQSERIETKMRIRFGRIKMEFLNK